MKFTQEKQLHTQLQKEGASGLYLLFGEEEYLVNRWRNRMVAPFEKEGGFNLQKFSGKEPNLYEVYDATQQLPLFAAQKCVLVDDMDPKKLLKKEQEQLEQIFQDLPEETLLILAFSGGTLEKSSAVGKKLIALADNYGTVVDFSFRDGAGLTRFLQGEAKQWGVTISATLAKELVRRCGKEMLVLENEIQKLAAYVGEGEITKEHLDAVVVPTTEERIFNLSRAILAGNGQNAMEILSNLFYLRESPIGIGSTLIMSYVDLYRVSAAKAEGKTAEDILVAFPYRGREFRIRNSFNTRISTEAVRTSLEILHECDRGMKSTPQDQEQQLEQAVVHLLAVRES